MIKLKNAISGRFKFETFKGVEDGFGGIIEKKGSRETKAGWFENLLLDQGLDGLGVRSMVASLSYCHVGTGAATPSVTDSSLQSPLAYTNGNAVPLSTTYQSSVAPYYISILVVKRFAEGVAAGNLTEVGIGWGSDSDNLFSRTLIKDSGGSPTSLTVAGDEYLDVTYELRVYPPDTDFTGTIDLGGVTYNYTARPGRINNASYWRTGTTGNFSITTVTRAYDGVIGDVFSLPAGSADTTDSGLSIAYSSGSLVGSCTYSWGLDSANFAGGIRSIGVAIGWTFWQVEFSAQSDSSAIDKSDTKVLNLTFSHSWARV